MAIPVTNFGKVTVSIGYDAVATTIVLSVGQGSRLPSTFPFPLVWWNATDFSDPADDLNKEIISITNRVGDTLTCVRAQEGTSGSTKNTAAKTYKMVLVLTAAMYNALLSRALSQTARGLEMSVHPDSDKAASQVRLLHADSIVMSDGEEVANWDDVDFNIAAAAGIGGLDTGSEAASTWYKLFAMYNGSTKGLMGQRAKHYKLDTSYTAGEDTSQGLRAAAANNKISQGFQLATAGLIEFIDVKLLKTGTPTGNFWFTIEANSGGVPSNTPLATSDKYDVSRLTTSAMFVRIPFRTPFSASAATQYHIVMQGDYTVSGANFASWRQDSTGSAYASGSKALFDSGSTTWTTDAGADMMFKVYVTENDVALVVPTGYRYAHVGWCYNNGSSNLKYFRQKDRTIFGGQQADWKVTWSSIPAVLIDLFAIVPPASVLFHCQAFSSSAANMMIGDLTCTDLISSGGNEVVGAMSSTPGTNNTAAVPPLGLGPYQGMMAVNSAGSVSCYLAAFEF